MKILPLIFLGLVASCGSQIDIAAQYPDLKINPAVALFDASSTYSMVQRDKTRREKFCRPDKKFLTIAASEIPKPEHQWVGRKRTIKNEYVEYRKKGVPFARAVAAKTDNYLHKGDLKSARQAINLLLNWAGSDELYVRSSRDVGATTGARATSAALDYLLPSWHILKYSEQLNNDERDEIEQWLERLVVSTKREKKFIQTNSKLSVARHEIYWGVITANLKYFEHGISEYIAQMERLRKDGSFLDSSDQGRLALTSSINSLSTAIEIVTLAGMQDIELITYQNKDGIGLVDAFNFVAAAGNDQSIIDEYAYANKNVSKRFKEFKYNSQFFSERKFHSIVSLRKSLLNFNSTGYWKGQYLKDFGPLFPHLRLKCYSL